MLDELIHLVAQVFVSCILLLVGLSVLLVGLSVLLFELGDPATQKLAAGWIGAVLGYWLQ